MSTEPNRRITWIAAALGTIAAAALLVALWNPDPPAPLISRNTHDEQAVGVSSATQDSPQNKTNGRKSAPVPPPNHPAEPKEFIVRCQSADGHSLDIDDGQPCTVIVRMASLPKGAPTPRTTENDRKLTALALRTGNEVVLRLAGEAIEGAHLLSVDAPGYVTSHTECSTSPSSVTLARSASIDLQVFGLPSDFLAGNNVVYEVFPEDPSLQQSDRLVFADKSFVSLRARVTAVKNAQTRIEGLVSNLRYASYLSIDEHNTIFAEPHFQPPQTVKVEADCSDYMKVTCDQPVDGVIAVVDGRGTAKSWYRTHPINQGVTWLHQRHDFTSSPQLVAWGSNWTGIVTADENEIRVKIKAAHNHRVTVGTKDPHELYVIQGSRLVRLGEYAPEGEPAAWFHQDHFIVRNVEVGQHLLVRNARQRTMSIIKLPPEATDASSELNSRSMGHIVNGPQALKNAMRQYPRNTTLVVLAALPVNGSTIEVKTRSCPLNEQGLQRFGEQQAWQLPQLPDGGRYIASIRESARKELGRFQLKWAKLD